MPKTLDAQWKVNTPGLLQEILNNPGTGILKVPLNIFQGLLAQVAERASEINDLQLNALMCRLALYEVANHASKEFDSELINKIINDALKERTSKSKQPKKSVTR